MADRKTNLLVTMVFDENSDMQKQVDAEIDFNDEIIKDLRHLVKGREIKHFIVADDTVINEKLNADAIIIPEGATNGDMIKAMFPNARIWEVTRDNIRCACVEFDDICEIKTFPLSWWNAPYKANCNLSEKSTGSGSEDK